MPLTILINTNLNTQNRSNFHLPTVTTVLRRVRGQSDRVVRECPTMFGDYNMYMVGTDLCDQRRGQYSTQRRSKKWWHCLFYFTLDILMVPRTHAHTQNTTQHITLSLSLTHTPTLNNANVNKCLSHTHSLKRSLTHTLVECVGCVQLGEQLKNDPEGVYQGCSHGVSERE